VVGFCEHGNEPMGSVTGGEFVDEMSDCCGLCCMESVIQSVSHLIS
jgi:uncharacterized cysteine cluster protein YcgN (CxxCxxCC family)